MVRSSHHLPLPSLPPPRVVLCSLFVVSLFLFLSFFPSSRKFEGDPDSGAAVSPHRIYRADPNPQRAYQYVNESPTGTTVTPLVPRPSVSIYRHYIGEDRYLACRPHFFSSPPRPDVPWTRFLFGCNPR